VDPRGTGLRAQARPPNQPPNPRGGLDGFGIPYFGVGLGRYNSYYYNNYYGSYYSPWYYGTTWGAGPWGYGYSAWHDPYLYGRYGYYGSMYPYYWGNLSDREGWSGDREQVLSEPNGALRLRVSPRDAKVYVGGALAGVVDEFDGLTNHLRLPAGRHQLEFRADGYESLTMDVTIDDGKTRTERASLKRK
jgi:PEGA domain